jgi:predicted MFS family arabinose efflux permease
MTISARHTMLLTFATFGAIVGTHVGALPFVVKNADVSAYAFGVVGSLGMLSNITAMSIGGWVNRHLDHRTVLLAILPMCFLAMIYTLVVQSLFSFGVSVMLLSFSLGTMDLFMNAEGSAVEQESGKPIFSSYHGSASLGIALFAIISSLVSAWVAPWFGALFAIIPVAVALGAIYTSIPKRAVEQHIYAQKTVVLPYRTLTFIGLAAGFNVTCEGAATLWAGQLLTSIAPQLAAYSGLGVAFYGVCGGTMRMFGDRLRVAYGDERVMTISLAVAILGFVVLSLAPGFAISVLAFAGVGFGLAIVFPSLFSLAAQLVPDGRAAAMSYVATIGGIPRVILPFILGWLAQTISLGAVFAACAIVALMAALIIVSTFEKVDRALPSSNAR